MLSAAEIIKKTDLEIESKKERRKRRIEREIGVVTDILIQKIQHCFTAEHKWSVDRNGSTPRYYTKCNCYFECEINFDLDVVPRTAVGCFLKQVEEDKNFSEYQFVVDYKWDSTPSLPRNCGQNGYNVLIKILIKD